MRYQATVAIILSVGLILILLSGTPFRFLWIDPAATIPPTPQEQLVLWKDLMLVLIGALAGFISGKGSDDGSQGFDGSRRSSNAKSNKDEPDREDRNIFDSEGDE